MTTSSAEDSPSTNPRASTRAHAAIWGTLGALAGVGGAILRSKVIAVKLGPEGTGLITEILQYATLAVAPAAVALGPAFLRRLSTTSDRLGASKHAFALTMALGLTGAIVVLAASSVLLPASAPVGLLGLALAWQLAQTLLGLPTQALTAATQFGRLAITNTGGALLVTCGLVVGVLAGGVAGQFVGAFLGALAALALGLALTWRTLGGLPFSLNAPPRAFLFEAVATGATGFVGGAAVQLALVVVRNATSELGGPALVGQFQASWTISTTYFSVLLGGLLSYSFPRFAAAKDGDEIGTELRAALRFASLAIPPLLIIAILFRRFGIHLLYDSRFEIAADILGYQLAGDVIKASAWLIAGPLLVRGKLKAFLITEIVGAIVLGGLMRGLLPWLGAEALGVGYLIGYACYAMLATAILRWACGVVGLWPWVALSFGWSIVAVAANELSRSAEPLVIVPAAGVAFLFAARPLQAHVRMRLSRRQARRATE